MSFPLREVVKAHTEHAGKKLELGGLLRVLARARIGGDGLAAHVGELVVFTELVDQRGRETLQVRGLRVLRRAGFAVDDQREDAVCLAEPLEREDLFVGPPRLRSARGADHDLAGGCPQGLGQHLPQAGGGREFLAVTKDGRESLRNAAHRRPPSDEALRWSVCFKCLVQPGSPFLVAMAVADEGLVLIVIGQRSYPVKVDRSLSL